MKAKFAVLCLLFLLLLPAARAEDAPRVFLRLTRLAEKGQAEDVSIGFAGKAGQELAGFWYPRYGEPLAVVMTVVRAGEEALISLWFYRDFSAVKLPPEQLYHVSAKWDVPASFTFDGSKFMLVASLKGWPERPKQAPEPTSRSVTPRAIVPEIELKQQNQIVLRHESRPLGPWLILDVRRRRRS